MNDVESQHMAMALPLALMGGLLMAQSQSYMQCFGASDFKHVELRPGHYTALLTSVHSKLARRLQVTIHLYATVHQDPGYPGVDAASPAT